MIRYREIGFTLDGSGEATVISEPIAGEVVSVRIPGGAWNGTADTSDVTITRRIDGGTVVALTNMVVPVQVQPRDAYHTVAGAVSGTAVDAGIPVEDSLTVVVTGGSALLAGTVFVYYRE